MNKAFPYQILVFTIHEKTKKSPYNNNKFKILAPTWNDIPVQIFKIILSIFQKNMEKWLKILQ